MQRDRARGTEFDYFVTWISYEIEIAATEAKSTDAREMCGLRASEREIEREKIECDAKRLS